MLRESRVNSCYSSCPRAVNPGDAWKEILQRFLRLRFHGDPSVTLMRRSSDDIGVISV